LILSLFVVYEGQYDDSYGFIMKTFKIFPLLCVLALVLGACGKKGELEPPEKYKKSVILTEFLLG